jgi:hypothetical protein
MRYQASREGYVRLHRDRNVRYACCWQCFDKIYYMTEYAAKEKGFPKDVIDILIATILASTSTRDAMFDVRGAI